MSTLVWGYTGHDHDADSGLVYMQQRYYDPLSGRFLSVDPVGVSTSNGGDFNRYWYAGNNPENYIDPDGRFLCARNFSGDCQGADIFNSPFALDAEVSPPETIEVEEGGFSNPGEAADAFGKNYFSEGVEDNVEFQTGIVNLGDEGYGYITPGKGPPGETILDPTAMFEAIVAEGFSIDSWAHTHFDDNLKFSGNDMHFVNDLNAVMFLTNKNGNTFELNKPILQKEARSRDIKGAARIQRMIQLGVRVQGKPVQ